MKSSLTATRVGPTGKESTVVCDSATGTTGAVSAVLAAGGANVLTYITGFTATFTNPTVGATIAITVGVLTGTKTLNYTQQVLAAGAAVPPPPPLVVNFPEPIPASALNAAITVAVGALGAGATAVAIEARGFQAPQSS